MPESYVRLALHRAGRDYPAALDEQTRATIDDAVVVEAGAVAVDPELRAAGRAHLEAILARTPGSFDGPILALDHVAGGVLHARRGSYFDMLATCDALIKPELRRRAEQLAAPDPLRSGRGRSAAIGVSLVVVRDGRFALGRRAAALALDPGRWHVVPSGTLDSRGLRATLADELREEHGLGDAVLDGARVIALGYDLTRLRPELVVMTRELGPLPAPRPGREFDAFRDVPLDLGAIAQLWHELAPADLTPAAALALAALERAL